MHRFSIPVLALATGLSGATPTLAPFVLPWDHAPSGPTSLASWNAAPAGAQGPVSVDADGHFSVGGRRIRFFGVNVTSGSNFPIAAHADAVAARLASFGVNSVRFHHMDAAWSTPPLLDYPSGSSRQLNTEAFARLHHFVQALKAQGIYSDINLLVSRHFTAADGFPREIEQIGWKDQHILGFFDSHALDLQKEYARMLLTTPGPDGAPPLGEDPAVAFVELLNENGIFQKWYEGVLDELPPVFGAGLQQRWNAWLRQRYGSSEALKKAWGGQASAPGEVRVASNLTEGSGWKAHIAPGSQSVVTASREGNGHAVIEAKVSKITLNSWEQVRLSALDISVTPGRLYTLSFAAKASRPTQLYGQIQPHADAPSVRLLSARVSAVWSRHQATFVAPENGSVSLHLGGLNVPGEYTFSDLTLREGGELQGLGHASLEKGTVPVIPALARSDARHTAEAERDWMRFLASLETAYWNDMQRFVKETLGYRGVVFGSIISNSPAGIQAALDSIDGHCYWTHPRFPGGDWDPENWVVEPKSMVAAPGASTIALLSKQRVKGKPFTVTEYQHSSPNPHSAEAPLFAAAYGALQDWDGIWLFDYTVPTDASALGEYAGRFSSFFDDSQHPARMVNYLLAAAMFRRGDVSPARSEIAVPLAPETEIELLRTRGSAWAMPDAATVGLDAAWALRRRVALDLKPTGKAAFEAPALSDALRHESDTGELLWDASTEAGWVRIHTPLTRALIGKVTGRSVEVGDVTFSLAATTHGWATAGLTLLEGSLTANEPARGLIVVTGAVENSNQQWKTPDRASLGTEWGDAPTRVETVRGEVILPVPPAQVTAYALDEHGQRRGAAKVQDKLGKAAIQLGRDETGATLWYEFVIQR